MLDTIQVHKGILAKDIGLQGFLVKICQFATLGDVESSIWNM
jgi:hypothetical protein